MLDYLTGDPGTGKTEILGWLRDLFEGQLGWTHGNEFVYLAQQNTMAGAIAGFRIHSWGDISQNPEDAAEQKNMKRIGLSEM